MITGDYLIFVNNTVATQPEFFMRHFANRDIEKAEACYFDARQASFQQITNVLPGGHYVLKPLKQKDGM